MVRYLARSAAALLTAAVLAACGSGGGTPSPGSPRPRSLAPKREGRTESNSPSTVDLTRLLTEVPEYQGQGRNLFGFGSERPQAEVGPAPDATTTVPIPLDESPATRPAAPPRRIDLKFAGYVEKPSADGGKKKYAVFLNGEEVLTGAEGDLVANRYRIVQIGLESATLAMEGSNVTQKIPLRTN